MSREKQLEVLLQEVADINWWGPRGPEGANSPYAATFTPPDALFRLGVIYATLAKAGFTPTKERVS